MQIGFVNFNTDEKKRIAQMMQFLNEPEAVEELGVGRVRDHFSDTLFPGTSSLQHHAKYFVVLPWMPATRKTARLICPGYISMR